MKRELLKKQLVLGCQQTKMLFLFFLLSFRCPKERITNKNKLFHIHLQLFVWCLRHNRIIYEIKCKLNTMRCSLCLSLFLTVFLSCFRPNHYMLSFIQIESIFSLVSSKRQKMQGILTLSSCTLATHLGEKRTNEGHTISLRIWKYAVHLCSLHNTLG